MSEPEIRIAGKRVSVVQDGVTLFTTNLSDFLAELAGTIETPPADVIPEGVRIWKRRRDAVAVAVEVKPHARTVRWIASDSKTPFGPGARYNRYFLAFPYVVLLLVFRRGALTGVQQLYYRCAPLDAGDELLLPNLYNVAEGYEQRCWVCLANLADVSRLAWPAKLHAIVDHVFTAAWNRSSEVHEGNSYFSAMKTVDARVATPEAWQEATHQNPRFPLDVKWMPAKTTVGGELARMLDRVVAPASIASAEDLVALLTPAAGRRRRA